MREQVAGELKPIYTAIDPNHAQSALEAFDEKQGTRFPIITQAWLNAREHVTPFLAFPPEVRRVTYTTDESVKERSASLLCLWRSEASARGVARRQGHRRKVVRTGCRAAVVACCGHA